jgi:hypothetical protein
VVLDMEEDAVLQSHGLGFIDVCQRLALDKRSQMFVRLPYEFGMPPPPAQLLETNSCGAAARCRMLVCAMRKLTRATIRRKKEALTRGMLRCRMTGHTHLDMATHEFGMLTVAGQQRAVLTRADRRLDGQALDRRKRTQWMGAGSQSRRESIEATRRFGQRM